MTENKLLSTAKPKRTYQDSIFRMLFSEKENAIELFNALEGTDYGPDTEVRFMTLDDVIYHGIKNDLSYEIAVAYLVFGEQQSTISANIPLRMLRYVSNNIITLMDSKTLFRQGQVKIPTPQFFVIYTGSEPWNVDELRLSSSFVGEPKENSIELVVKVIKVVYNEGEEEEARKNPVLQRSAKLREYGILVRYVKEGLAAGKDRKEAVDTAIERCLKENILADFLRTHSAEVEKMAWQSITMEEFIEIRAEEAAEIAAEKATAETTERVTREVTEEVTLEVTRKAIRILIADNLEEGKTEAQIIEKLKRHYDLSKDEAAIYIEEMCGKK
ncbi:MAG: hypothetical protein MR303_09925 [Emergencia sp.]|nr:hypothetical protein [Emergencia sp.]